MLVAFLAYPPSVLGVLYVVPYSFSALLAEGSLAKHRSSRIVVVTAVFGGYQFCYRLELFFADDWWIFLGAAVHRAFEDSLYHLLVPFCFALVVVDTFCS